MAEKIIRQNEMTDLAEWLDHLETDWHREANNTANPDRAMGVAQGLHIAAQLVRNPALYQKALAESRQPKDAKEAENE